MDPHRRNQTNFKWVCHPFHLIPYLPCKNQLPRSSTTITTAVTKFHIVNVDTFVPFRYSSWPTSLKPEPLDQIRSNFHRMSVQPCHPYFKISALYALSFVRYSKKTKIWGTRPCKEHQVITYASLKKIFFFFFFFFLWSLVRFGEPQTYTSA